MKYSVLALTAGAATAFSPAARSTRATNVALNAEGDNKGKMSQALPFAACPKMLDGSLPGDVGFE